LRSKGVQALFLSLTGLWFAGICLGGEPLLVEALEKRLVTVREKVAPAVVSISSVGGGRFARGNIYQDPFKPYKQRFFGEKSGPPKKRNLGSGVVIDPGGYILTNYHVVADARQVFVALSSGKVIEGRVLGFEPSVDLAVIKIDLKTKLAALEWVDAKKIRPGQFAIAFGNPWGIASDPQPTMTMGIISAVNRSISVGGGDGREFKGLLQTDAAINPGNSGGPLVDINGRILGINTAIFSTTGGNQGIGFAVPITRDVERIIGELKKGRKLRMPHVGIRAAKIDPAKAKLLNFRRRAGVVVERVDPDGTAARAGLKTGDVIFKVGDRDIADPFQLKNCVGMSRIGEKLDFHISRAGREMRIPVSVGSDQKGIFADLSPRVWRGLSVANPDPASGAKGVRVQEVVRGSAAWQAGVRAGDIITKVNDMKIESPADFGDAVKDSERHDVLIETSRGLKIVKKQREISR